MLTYCILRDGKPVPVSMDEWSVWFANIDNRRIDLTDITDSGITVSTVFIGIGDDLFETLVFGGPLNGLMQRYATLDEAKQGHNDVVKRMVNNPFSEDLE